MPTQNEYNVVKQGSRIQYIEIELLNSKFQTIGTLTGEVKGTPSFSINISSEIRRACSFTLEKIDSSFDIKSGGKIWIDKNFKIYAGIKETATGDTIKTNMGIYIINNPSQAYNLTENSLTIEGLDLMARLTGLRGGKLLGTSYMVLAGTNVRTAIIQTIALGGFDKYVCEECPVSVPNDISISSSGTIYNLLSQLKSIYPQYQMYFDVDGIFRYELTPSGDNEQVFASDDILLPNLINYRKNYDFENLKNYIIVYGKTHDITNFGTAVVNTLTYTLTISSVSALYDGLKIGFVAPTQITTPYINLNSYGTIALKNEDGTFAELEDDTDVYYVAKYDLNGDYWMFMGTLTPIGIAFDDNPDSPYYTEGSTGILDETLKDGDYDYIYTSELAQERAEWELYNRCKIKDSITLILAPIYWMNVNKIIEITLPDEQGTSETNKYITKQIQTSYGVSGTQTVTAMRYYPYYSNP